MNNGPKIIECTITMQLIEERNFSVRRRRKKEYLIEAAENSFVEILRDPTFDIWDYVQSKIVEDPT